jgi:hypothetical protein
MSAFGLSSVQSENNSFTEKVAVLKITGPTSYDTGGSVLDLSAAGLGSAKFVAVFGVQKIGADDATGAPYRFEYQRGDTSGAPATGKILVYSGGSEVTAATNLSARTFLVVVRGR